MKEQRSRLMTYLLTLVMALMILPVQAQKNKMKDKTKVMVTEEGYEYELSGWDSRVVYDPHSYSFIHWDTPIYETVKTKEVYPVAMTEFEKAPVFTEACVGADDPVACTNEALQEFITERPFDYPERAQYSQQEGLEYVSFTLNEKGEFEGRPSVLNKDKGNACTGCADQAVKIISETEGKWQPAVLDGEQVKVMITVPVRFKLQDVPFR